MQFSFPKILCRVLALMLALMLPGIAAEAQVSFTGNAAAPVIDNPESSTGLSAVYVLSNTAGVTINYTAASACQR